MAGLEDPRWEDFARARADGMSHRQARVAAGYSARGAGAPWRIRHRARVEARIAELVRQNATLREANLEETILALLDLTTRIDAKTAAGAKEARAARLEAWRLNGLLAQRREAETWSPPRQMTEAEWDAKYGPDAPGGVF